MQPKFFAVVNLDSSKSIPKILIAPANLAAYTTESPTAPNPKTATELYGLSFAVFHTAPQPVETPQPSRQTFFRSEFLSIFAAEISEMTVYSLKVLQPIKWKMGSPYKVVKREVLSGISPLPWESLI